MDVYSTQLGPDEEPEAFNLSHPICFDPSTCPLWKRGCCRCCRAKMLFFKSRSGLGMDLSFIVDLSFVGKLMRLCPLTHKSPSPAVLHYEPQGSTNPSNRIGGTIAPFFLTSHLCSWLFSSARVFIAHGFQPPCVF